MCVCHSYLSLIYLHTDICLCAHLHHNTRCKCLYLSITSVQTCCQCSSVTPTASQTRGPHRPPTPVNGTVPSCLTVMSSQQVQKKRACHGHRSWIIDAVDIRSVQTLQEHTTAVGMVHGRLVNAHLTAAAGR